MITLRTNSTFRSTTDKEEQQNGQLGDMSVMNMETYIEMYVDNYHVSFRV